MPVMSETSTVTLPTEAETSISLTATPATSSGHHGKDAATSTVTLRSLYSRATRAFLQRDINLTVALITESALPLLSSPPPLDDPLATWRRKWDILNITLETMVYATPPADPESLPARLRANLMLSPQSLLATLHTRSLSLFTPVLPDSQIQGSLNAAYLPSQVLLTLAFASMKLGVPYVGRGMIEDWLARRDGRQDEGEGYDKVVELYCLHILPRLEEWEYATEFLQYEGQLESARRQRLLYSLESLHSETMASRQQRPRTPSTPPLSPSSTPPSRPVSPSGSSVSSSSEQTATPLTPRFDAEDPKGKRKALPMSMTSISGSPSVSDSTNTSRTATPMPPQVVRYKQKQRYSLSSAPVLDPPTSASSVTAPSTLALIKSTFSMVKSSLIPHVGFATLVVLALALISLIRFRRSRRRLQITNGGTNTPASALNSYTLRIGTRADGTEVGTTVGSAVDEVRKKLASPGGTRGTSGIIGSVWNEAVRVVSDTVRMGGRGLI